MNGDGLIETFEIMKRVVEEVLDENRSKGAKEEVLYLRGRLSMIQDCIEAARIYNHD